MAMTMTRPSRSLPLLLCLLLSKASAFSPAAVQGVIGSHPFPRFRDESSHKPKQLLSSFHHAKYNGKSDFRLASSLAMKAIAVEERPAYKKRIAVFMAFLTGWADTLFIRNFSFFGTMMTGNSMKLGWALVDGRIRDGAFYLTIIASYILGVGVFRRAELSFKDRALNVLFAPIVAACFVGSDYLAWINASRFLPGLLLAFSWGIINSVGSEVTGTLIFVVTGAMVS